MANMNISSSTISASINQAINFLTRPLILTQSPDMVASLQSILRTTLQAVYHDSRLTLSFSAISLPPRPVYAACIASGFHWADWIQLLGARDFDLIIEPHVLKVVYAGAMPRIVTIWREATAPPVQRALYSRLNFQEPQVPISKLGQQSLVQASLRATVNSALARAQTRTLAQQLLESDHKQEADEIFAMISKSIMSPTPTREQFPKSFMPSPPSPDSSRPSSRSSTFSTFSFSDDDESVTSASSISSFDFLASTKPITTPVNTFNKNAPAFVPRQPRVFIDNAKKDVTKYLYQGGVSTVLTGGVMLGGGAANGPKAVKPKIEEVPKYRAANTPNVFKPKPEDVPKYRAPVGGKKFAVAQNAATTNSWRRNTTGVQN
ncbi:hypothetical protein M413DRAFT_440766 [Hebeloma cylindrosporum]|uniref:Anti-proliferative protein domain-containing protein n=1 Tax=Hebeloma cylindrosporum TaxID=76867 RepID=A0A0C3CTX0_HEBCY|nr:hypothetical protein M413DRAFT_440766 [Hebeloma cylindrosporum h7]